MGWRATDIDPELHAQGKMSLWLVVGIQVLTVLAPQIAKGSECDQFWNHATTCWWPNGWTPLALLAFKHKTSSSHEEGSEREFSIMTKEFVTMMTVTFCLKTVQVRWEKQEGEDQSLWKSPFWKEWPCDLALLALGFTGPSQLWQSNSVFNLTNAQISMQTPSHIRPIFLTSLLLGTCDVVSLWSFGQFLR